MAIGALLQQAKKDAALFASAGGFQVDVILQPKDRSVSLPVTGLGTGTWMVFDDTRDGKSINSSSNHFDVPEQLLIDGAYPYKNSRGLISLVGHFVTLNDGAGMSGTFVINEQHPNATLGLVICMLGRLAE